MHITHITIGQAGLHADDSQQLRDTIQRLQEAGYLVTDIEDDADEPWHVATIHYTGGATQLSAIKSIIHS